MISNDHKAVGSVTPVNSPMQATRNKDVYGRLARLFPAPAGSTETGRDGDLSSFPPRTHGLRRLRHVDDMRMQREAAAHPLIIIIIG